VDYKSLTCHHYAVLPTRNNAGYWTTRGLPTRGLDDWRIGRLADWTTRGLDISQTGQLTD